MGCKSFWTRDRTSKTIVVNIKIIGLTYWHFQFQMKNALGKALSINVRCSALFLCIDVRHLVTVLVVCLEFVLRIGCRALKFKLLDFAKKYGSLQCDVAFFFIYSMNCGSFTRYDCNFKRPINFVWSWTLTFSRHFQVDWKNMISDHKKSNNNKT